jgi:hypothetical protein
MIYNKQNIKQFKSKLVEITHFVYKKGNKYPQIQTGDIVGEGKKYILFRIHKRDEIPIKYDDITNIGDPEKSNWNQST